MIAGLDHPQPPTPALDGSIYMSTSLLILVLGTLTAVAALLAIVCVCRDHH